MPGASLLVTTTISRWVEKSLILLRYQTGSKHQSEGFWGRKAVLGTKDPDCERCWFSVFRWPYTLYTWSGVAQTTLWRYSNCSATWGHRQWISSLSLRVPTSSRRLFLPNRRVQEKTSVLPDSVSFPPCLWNVSILPSYFLPFFLIYFILLPSLSPFPSYMFFLLSLFPSFSPFFLSCAITSLPPFHPFFLSCTHFSVQCAIDSFFPFFIPTHLNLV